MGAAPGSIIATIMTAHMPPASSASVALHGPAGAMCIAAMSAISWPRRERESQASRVSPARPSRAATPSRRATASISSSRPTRARGGGRARTPSAWDAILRFHSPCGSLCGRTLTEPRMRTIRIGHSPDPDDAFMFYALTAGKVRIPGVRIEHMLEDIESLNRRARTAELEVTAVSFATYLLVADGYRMMRSEEHTSELQSLAYIVCRLLLEKKNLAAHATNNTQRCLHEYQRRRRTQRVVPVG